MAWVDPTSRATGYLVTAAVWDQDVVDNTQFLHDRIVTQFIPCVDPGAGLSDVGDFSGASLSTTNNVRMAFCVPDDFDTLTACDFVIISSASTTIQYDLTSDYGNPDTPEAYNTHSESESDSQLAVTADKFGLIDATGVLTALAAGDMVGIALSRDNVGDATQYVLGIRLQYTQV